jgi:hypothetical protein
MKQNDIKEYLLHFTCIESSWRIIQKSIPLFCGLSLIFNISMAQDCYWSSHIGGEGTDGSGVIGSDRNGNVYVFGSTQSPICYFNSDSISLGGFNQGFFVKYDGVGNEVWIKQFYGPSISFDLGYISISGIIDTIRDVILVYGHFYNQLSLGDTVLLGNGQTILVMKMGLDGHIIWARTGGGTGKDFALGLSYDENGNIYMSGCNEKEATFGETTIPAGGFLAKYTTDGNLVWAKQKFREFSLYPPYPEYPYTEAPPFNLLYSKNKLLVYGEIYNDTIVIDTITLFINNPRFISTYIASFDTTGNIEWIKLAGGPEGGCGGTCLFTTDSSGSIYITGVYSKKAIFENDTLFDSVAVNDCFFAKYKSDGEFVWSKPLNSYDKAEGRGILSDRMGNVYLAGMFRGKIYFGSDTLISESSSDMFLAKYTYDGICEGVRQYSEGKIFRFGISQSGNILWAGSFTGTLDIGPHTFVSYGGEDIFVAECSPINGIAPRTMPQQTQLLIYANPNAGKCSIKIPEEFRHEKNMILQIYDSKGRMIQQIPMELTADRFSLDISAEASGIYMATLSNGKRSYSGKIIFSSGR